MTRFQKVKLGVGLGIGFFGGLIGPGLRAATETAAEFPRPLDSYPDTGISGVLDVLRIRIEAEPFNLAATIVFGLAILHTFFTARFRHWAHMVEEEHARRIGHVRTDANKDGLTEEVSFKGQILHFFGEVEAVFGIWSIVLFATLITFKGWGVTREYIGHHVNFTEPVFVVVIMALASTRPILRFAEQGLRAVAQLGKGSPAAWWLTLLIVAPILGSLITEPAAMTIAALLLGRQFYALKPSPRFAYATLGLLFVNISVGGTFTHFAAPPVLMVAEPWGWNLPFMFEHFGWRAGCGIVTATLLYWLIFRKEFAALKRTRDEMEKQSRATEVGEADAPIPAWITILQIGFMAWTVFVAHYPAFFVGGFLFFLAFSRATAHHQGSLDLQPPMLVGFFLAGLVIHGGLQGWWIEPVLKSLGENALFFSATGLTAINDNAAITYLATLVPGFTEDLKYAVVAGAVTGGGLTVIANAPNPAGQSILQRFFPQGISPAGLFLGALIPTMIMCVAFLVL